MADYPGDTVLERTDVLVVLLYWLWMSLRFVVTAGVYVWVVLLLHVSYLKLRLGIIYHIQETRDTRGSIGIIVVLYVLLQVIDFFARRANTVRN